MAKINPGTPLVTAFSITTRYDHLEVLGYHDDLSSYVEGLADDCINLDDYVAVGENSFQVEQVSCEWAETAFVITLYIPNAEGKVSFKEDPHAWLEYKAPLEELAKDLSGLFAYRALFIPGDISQDYYANLCIWFATKDNSGEAIAEKIFANDDEYLVKVINVEQIGRTEIETVEYYKIWYDFTTHTTIVMLVPSTYESRS